MRSNSSKNVPIIWCTIVEESKSDIKHARVVVECLVALEGDLGAQFLKSFSNGRSGESHAADAGVQYADKLRD